MDSTIVICNELADASPLISGTPGICEQCGCDIYISDSSTGIENARYLCIKDGVEDFKTANKLELFITDEQFEQVNLALVADGRPGFTSKEELMLAMLSGAEQLLGTELHISSRE